MAGEYTITDQIAASTNDNWATWVQQIGTSGVPAPGGGYTLDTFGGVYPVGDSPPVDSTGCWLGWDIARAIPLDPTPVASAVEAACSPALMGPPTLARRDLKQRLGL